MYRLDQKLSSLIEQAQAKGSVTFQQVDQYLPDEGGDPAMVEHLLHAMEELWLDIIDDPKVPEAPKKDKSAQNGKERESGAGLLIAKSLMAADPQALSSRDPIRMYLSQMGNIPLLSRAREIFLAKQIEITRKRFRRTLLESDFALRIAVETVEKVQAGELPFERTLRTSETENVRKEQILGRMNCNLKTLRHLMEQNEQDFQRLNSEGPSRTQRNEINNRMLLRRRKMATLCEELSVRTHRLQPVLKRIQQIAERVTEVQHQIADLGGRKKNSRRCENPQARAGGTCENDARNTR